MSKKCKRSVKPYQISNKSGYFTLIMSKQGFFSFSGLILISFVIWIFSTQKEVDADFNERVKLSLRDVGNQLLLADGDSTSLVLPVLELKENKFQLSFEKHLAFMPDSLAEIFSRSFRKSNLPESYRVEVIDCKSHQTVHSFEIKSNNSDNIIPCLGRPLDKDCYQITVRFTQEKGNSLASKPILYISVFGIFGFVVFGMFKRKRPILEIPIIEDYFSIGSYIYFQEQSKLVRAGKEINLSNKENELLIILVENINQIVKREELSKRVWEDNGVFVGRSLDTYISKLRKKFAEDDTIKITNVHGIGYKLEVEQQN
ncbi:Transcriptional regulatory protein, C terminal [Flavobacteriaceae bacterium MAR_2010_188]|nr:Transcriptional regulatory protein, C terminal [Flavobacteriaceae bacterium MAR_2010_188]